VGILDPIIENVKDLMDVIARAVVLKNTAVDWA